VDLERVRPLQAVEQLAERILSAREKALMHALPPSRQQEFFLQCWTRKEAYVKASGDGLIQPLDRIDVSLSSGEPLGPSSIEGNAQEASRWSLYELTPAAGYVAALVAEGHSGELACWQWPVGSRIPQPPDRK
jgi:4'-phosphopantetheinyl transferase